jgi:hypothetical protein
LLFLLRQGTQALEMHLRFLDGSSLAASFLALRRPLAGPSAGAFVVAMGASSVPVEMSIFEAAKAGQPTAG